MDFDYKIELTPLKTLTTYESAIDITEYVKFSEFPSITREIDQGNFEIGVFNFGSLTFTAKNETGKFNEPEFDGRSIFPLKRDNAKVKLTYYDIARTAYVCFDGLINEIATTQNLNDSEITFTVLSFDSIFDKISVDPGSIVNGYTFEEAFEVLLNRPEITNILTYSASNINPTVSTTIDNGSAFNSAILKDAIDQLLQASNSILLIDSSNNIIIRSRTENSNTPHELFLNDQFKRDNIISIPYYNSGKQRLFNSIVVNGIRDVDSVSITANGANQQDFTFEFITDNAKAGIIAQSIIDNFGSPKIELNVIIDRDALSSINILDKVVVDIDYQISHKTGIMPLYEYAKYEIDTYPDELTELRIMPSKTFKIIAITDTPIEYTIELKLREI